MSGIYCSACEEELGHPEEELHNPEGLMDFGEIHNPDSHHIKVIDGSKGPRMQCAKNGQMTKLVRQEPEGSEQPAPPQQEAPANGEPSPSQPKVAQVKAEPVYDFKEDTDPMGILQNVIMTPVFGLNDPQIQEIMSWGDIFDGQVPPDKLEDILKNLDGISNQKAHLMRQKYEYKLSKWVRDQADERRGPSLGAMSYSSPFPQGTSPMSGGRQSQPQPGPFPSSDGEPETEPREGGTDGEVEDDNVRQFRRKRRVERRNDAIDRAAQEFADEAARNMAQDFGGFFSDIRDIFRTAFKKKAEKDPDWFFEQMDRWDMDILGAILEPSETRKEELRGGGSEEPMKPMTDSEVDKVLQEMEDNSPPPQEPEPVETTKPPDDVPDNSSPMTAAPEDYEGEEEEEMSEEDEVFAQIAGDLTE